MTEGWRLIDDAGTFELPDPEATSGLYFPLANEAGLLSSITPSLHGDSKIDQHHFLLPPATIDDLQFSSAARNFWVLVEGYGPWSATGQSARQIAARSDRKEKVTLQAGLLWHRVTREAKKPGLRAEITNLIPPGQDWVELMQVRLTNVSKAPLSLVPTAAIRLYGRSADNVRDHRHVTSLLHRIWTDRYGVLVRPTLSFDERGHSRNNITYAVLGAEQDTSAPEGFFPALEDFIGEGGSFDWPAAVARSESPLCPPGTHLAGVEAIGGIRFRSLTLPPGATRAYIVVLAILEDQISATRLVERYGSADRFHTWFERTVAHWQHKVSPLSFRTDDRDFDRWLKWVTVQPVLRRLYGNSFLPYHDYGRGGRGWRDLWQDCLALLLLEPEQLPDLLYSNFAGVRIDGSNATIVGALPGQFIADRNNIARVWMDHGAWPFLTTELYLQQSGDLDFILREQSYFRDAHIDRAGAIDPAWRPEQGTELLTTAGSVYRGTLLEHLLVQHLTAFFNVGDHNNLRLEGADWNDGLDMAGARGESVAFSSLYAGNLRALAELALALDRRGTRHVLIASELILLLDRLASPVDYASPQAKQTRLNEYYKVVHHTVSGEQLRVSLQYLAHDLRAKADWLSEHLRADEWVTSREGYSWFNGYYDDEGRRVEGDFASGVRMTLTGQVFPLMCGVATDAQCDEIVRSVDHYLADPAVGGYRLNTDFGQAGMTLGRSFSYAFGTKENGAMFSHMAVMYAYALYTRGLARRGYETLSRLYRHCSDFGTSRIYPGIPEYFDNRGRGAYPYLTGSASWLLLTLVSRSYGVKGRFGDLALEPMLVREQFDVQGLAALETEFAGARLGVTYHNPARLEFGEYLISSVALNGRNVEFERSAAGVLLRRAQLSGHALVRLDVTLDKRP